MPRVQTRILSTPSLSVWRYLRWCLLPFLQDLLTIIVASREKPTPVEALTMFCATLLTFETWNNDQPLIAALIACPSHSLHATISAGFACRIGPRHNPLHLYQPQTLGHLGMITHIKTMIPARENSEVVIKFTQNDSYFLPNWKHVNMFPSKPPFR